MATQSSATTLRLAISQSHTLSSTALTLSALEATVHRARAQNADLLLFPEAYLGGYPRTATFGSAIGARSPSGREQYLHYFKDAVDLGDIPEGGGQRWVERSLETPREGRRGDGTREELERIARETGVFLVVGVVERCAGTLYCGVVYVCPRLGCVGKRRKVMPVCLPPFRSRCLELSIIDDCLDRIRTIDLGPGPAELVESCYDHDQEREAHACGGYMLGKLHAASTTELVQSECQSIPCADGGWEGYVV